MLDSNFRRGVILLCDHEEDGSFGFLLNKPLDINITNLISTFPDFESNIYYGGPVQTDTIHYLHTKGDLLDNSVKIVDGLYFGGDFEQLKDAIRYKKINTRDIKFFVGYSGWEAGQLTKEQEHYTWLSLKGKKEFILNTKSPSLWRNVLEEQEGSYSIIGNMKLPNFN